MPDMSDVTLILQQIDQNDRAAVEQLFPLLCMNGDSSPRRSWFTIRSAVNQWVKDSSQ